MRKFSFLTAAFVLFGALACKKYVDPGFPATQLSKPAAFSNNATATSAVLALYGQLERSGLLSNMVIYTGLSSDEFALRSTYPLYLDLLNNNIQPASNFTDLFWKALYQEIYWSNSVLEGLDLSATIDASVKRQLEGEARYIRAYCYFQLVNFFGKVPIIKSTDYRSNSAVIRSAVVDVYKFIESDLSATDTLVSVDYKSPKNISTNERTRINKYAVSAFRSKVALYQGKWDEAETFASDVIGQNSLYALLPNLSDVFLKNSKEQIWQIQSIAPNANTSIGSSMILTATPTTVHLDERILPIFYSGDKRRATWIGLLSNALGDFYFIYKYKIKSSTVTSEYSSMMRLGEVYLIRSEARAMQGKVAEAVNDLNEVRLRAGTPSLSGLNNPALLDSIFLERRRELFGENANRWFDLNRTNRANDILGAIKGSNWAPTDALYPIPFSEIQKNGSLTQNPGY